MLSNSIILKKKKVPKEIVEMRPKGFKETSQISVKLITMYTWAGRHVACGFMCEKAEEERKGSE